MEARRPVSALGHARALDLWRSSVPLLSADLLASWPLPRNLAAMGKNLRSLYLSRTDRIRHFDVPARAPMVRSPRRHLRRRLLRAQSLSLGRSLLAQRLRRVARRRPDSSSFALYTSRRGRRPSRDLAAWTHRGSRLADQRPGCRDGELLARSSTRDCRRFSPELPCLAVRGRGGRTGLRLGSLLPCPCR